MFFPSWFCHETDFLQACQLYMHVHCSATVFILCEVRRQTFPTFNHGIINDKKSDNVPKHFIEEMASVILKRIASQEGVKWPQFSGHLTYVKVSWSCGQKFSTMTMVKIS